MPATLERMTHSPPGRKPLRFRFGLWLAFLAAFLLQVPVGQGIWPELGMAHAQDDDGGDDDGGDDDGGDDDGGDDDGGDDDGGGRSSAGPDGGDDRARAPQRTRRATPPGGNRAGAAAPPPAFAPGEIIVTNLSDTDLAALLAEGFIVIERIGLVDVAVVLHRLGVPEGLTLEEARARVRAQPTGATGDFNHYYRSEEDQQGAVSPASGPTATPVVMVPPPPCAHLNCAALDLIGWPMARDLSPSCRVTVPVGVIDTGVNAAHESLEGANIEVLRLVAEEVDPSKAVHGTAVAALLVGQVAGRAPGLIPEAQVVAVDVFGRDGQDERASVASLVKALDLLAARGVRVINMSLAGPPNAALEAALARLALPGGAVVLAAAGNGGPGADTAYPAGYPSVVAVTAVDQRGQVYRRAQRGDHVDLAAPGVEVWSATSISGVRPKTGTSFAVPFASAVAAILASRDPAASPADVAEQLRSFVRDLGAPGQDDVFGAGLLALDGLCPPQISSDAVE